MVSTKPFLLSEATEREKELYQKLLKYGVGRRGWGDPLFKDDKPPPRLGVYDLDDEDLCHEVYKSTCSIPGCTFTSETLLDYENHYNASHRYSCGQCKKMLPSPHLLDLHIQENHDSFFAVMAERKPSYCCYIEECKEKFKTPEDRWSHCIDKHKLPKDFKFEQQRKARRKTEKTQKTDNNKNNEKTADEREDDDQNTESMQVDQCKKFYFNNSKQKTFKYTGKKFTKKGSSSKSVNIDVVMSELKESLPE